MTDTDKPDAAARLWAEIEAAHRDLAANRLKIGKLFFELKNLYSERSRSAARRLSGKGVFEREIKKRGFKPNRVREMICDYEVNAGLRPATESTAAKREARRIRGSDEYARGFRAGQKNPFGVFGEHDIFVGSAQSDSWSEFAKILSYREARSAYRAAATRLHPDHAGDAAAMAELNRLWERLEPLYIAKESRSAPDRNDSTEQTVQ